MGNDEILAFFRENNRGGYDIYARYNKGGLFRMVEQWPTLDMARKSVLQLCDDDQMRHALLRDTKGWDFELKKFIVKKPRKRLTDEEKAERENARRVHFSFEE